MLNRVRPNLKLVLPALVLALLVAGFGGLSAVRKIQSFQPIGFEALLDGGQWLVTAVEAPETGLAEGDMILQVNGQGFAHLAELGPALRTRPASELLLIRDGELETVSYRLPPLEIDFTYLVLALIGIGYLFIGFYTLLRDRRRPALLFYLWCLTSAIVYLVTVEGTFDALGKASYMFEEVARLFLAPLTLHLFAVFPGPTTPRDRIQRAVPFFYLPAAFLLLLQTDLIFFNGGLLVGGNVASTLEILDRLELFHLVGFALAAASVLVWRLWRRPEAEAQRQTIWIAVGMTAGYLPFLLLYIVPSSLGFRLPGLVNSLAVLPLALVPLTFAYAILRYKLWDIGVIVRDTMTLSLTVLIGVVGFSLANLTISRAMPENLAWSRNLVAFVSGLMIAGLLIPTRRGISSSLERIQYRSRFGRRRALAEFGRELLKERNLDRLNRMLAEQLELSLDLTSSNLLLVRGKSLVATRREEGLPEFISIDEVDAESWEADVKSLSGVEFPTGGMNLDQRLYALGYRYAFPLSIRDSEIGLLVTGYKQDEVPLSSDDIDLIRNLLNQAALAIENAQLLHQVREQLDEVSRLQRFSQGIIQSSPAGIAVLNRSGRVLSANGAFAAFVGVEESEIAGTALRELLPVEPLPRPSEGIREVSIVDPAGAERYVQISTAPLQEGDESLRVLVMQDVSERVEMENQLKEKDRLASLGMLAAGVAHEVNTPITGISSYAQMLLADTPEDDPRHSLLKKMEKQTFRAADIVNSLLDFSRERSSERHPLSMPALLHECLDLLEERISDYGTTLSWSRPDERIQVEGNGGELQQVFTNLVVNALDAMGHEGGQLKVELEADERWVWAAVEDSGPGMSPQELDKIFQPFYSTKLGSGGTGLGLSISYDIVRRHSGNIRVISQPGEGCRFVVELPRHQPADASAAR